MNELIWKNRPQFRRVPHLRSDGAPALPIPAEGQGGGAGHHLDVNSSAFLHARDAVDLKFPFGDVCFGSNSAAGSAD